MQAHSVVVVFAPVLQVRPDPCPAQSASLEHAPAAGLSGRAYALIEVVDGGFRAATRPRFTQPYLAGAGTQRERPAHHCQDSLPLLTIQAHGGSACGACAAAHVQRSSAIAAAGAPRRHRAVERGGACAHHAANRRWTLCQVSIEAGGHFAASRSAQCDWVGCFDALG